MFIPEKWIASVVEVVRVNERIMYVKLVIGKLIGNIVSAYPPQVGLSGCDLNDHFGRDAETIEIKKMLPTLRETCKLSQ